MADSNAPVTFAVPGHRAEASRGAAAAAPLPGGLRAGTVETSVQVAVSRDAGVVRVQAIPGTHVVALTIDGGPELILHPHVARELLQAQAQPADRASRVTPSGDVLVPPTLRWPSPESGTAGTRSGLSDVVGGIVVKGVSVLKDVVRGAAKDAAADVATDLLAKAVDSQVTEGVYRLRRDVLDLKGQDPLRDVPSAGDARMLVFIHGTFSSTAGGFGQLWSESADRVGDLFGQSGYGREVFALDHATLRVSPIHNALTLAAALPKDARLHLVTHSRGGLVAEVLARLCARQGEPLTPAELQAFIPEQRDQLQELAGVIKERRPRVERIVRVAAPIRGTLLASKRLDVYLSVLKWGMDLAGWPVAGAVVDFLASIATHRLDPKSLAGLEAQGPNSPLVQWLHADPRPIPGELRVVSGDVEGDSVFTWIKTLMSDGFFWTDNDLVVQTRSMYGGARRQAGATFALDQGGKVLHTRYFAKDRVADAVFRAVLNDQRDLREFRTVGPLSWSGEDSSGDRAAKAPHAGEAAAAGSRPAVFLVPGFGESRLAGTNGLVWPTAMATSTIEQLTCTADTQPLTASSFVGQTFDTLDAALASTHDVIRFPYDWRLSLNVEAERLARAIDTAIDERVKTRQPVRLLTHSSGALLVRVVQLDHPQVWERLMAHPDTRLVMLAPLNAGSWMPMQVLSGDETFGGLLTAGAPPFSEPRVRDVFGTMPGLMQLQAGLAREGSPLDHPETWTQLAAADAAHDHILQSWHNLEEQQEQDRWGRLSDAALDCAVTMRRRLDTSARGLRPEQAAKMAIVSGFGTATPDGIPDDVLPNRDAKTRGIVYSNTARGDGRVTVEHTRLPGVQTWMVESDHASLPSLADAIPGYLDLLTTGTTKQLPALREAALGDEVRTRGRASRRLPPSIPESEADLFLPTRASRRSNGRVRRALRIRVVNGDLTFVREPLVVGHYVAMRLTGTEMVMDRLIGQAMSRSLAIDVYPDRPGTCQVFVNTHVRGDDRIRVPRPKAVVVVGLGEEGKLTAADLVRTVRKGVVAWAQRMAEQPDAAPVFDLATTLIGSGGKGMTVTEVAPLLAEAVGDADALLESAELPRVGELKIIELFLDRASVAWRALMQQAQQAPDRFEVASTITTELGALRRPPEANYRGADYDFVSIVSRRAADGGSELMYSLDTRRARTDVARQVAQMPLLLQLLDSSNMQPAPAQIGRTLFDTLVPIQIEPLLGASTDMVLELDEGTAGLPWELLDTTAGARQQAVPWAIRSRIVRKLRLETNEPPRADATADDHVLVIGEPQCDPDRYLRLAGARREANAVAERFERNGGPRVTKLIAPDDEQRFGPDSAQVIAALHEYRYRIIHIAGHGEPTVTGKRLGGVVLSPFGPDKQETFLDAEAIRRLRTVPELVFVNCCHVGARERLQLLDPGSAQLHRYDRPGFAAGLAQALIGIGVRCVIVAGWAVDDVAAAEFATTFYGALLDRRRFIDATADARVAAAALGGTTWAAFQCWGDPEWQYRRETSDAQQERPGTDWRYRHAGVASPESLVIALETITTRATFERDDAGNAPVADLRAGIGDLEQRFGETWGRIGRVADAFGAAYAEINDLPSAASWFADAIKANDGTASLRAAEQLSNMRVRTAWKKVSSLVPDHDELTGEQQAQLKAAADTIQAEILSLRTFLCLRETMELASVLGSAYKRLAMVAGKMSFTREASAKSAAASAEHDAIVEMRQSYAKAEELGGRDHADVFYPAWNRLVAEAMVLTGTSRVGLKPEDVATYRTLLARKNEHDPDFWSSVGEIELPLVEAVASGTLAGATEQLSTDFVKLADRVPSARMWASVEDNATFVLGIYRRRLESWPEDAASAAELSAIDDVLSLLRKLAGKDPSPARAQGLSV